jgi:hypothetical protein
MRTIKFRGKVQGYNTWVYGSLVQDKEGNCIIISTPECAIEPMQRTLVHSETVGQFTGLLDCNGKEIYEGDILADVNGFMRKVAFVENAASPMLIWLNDEDIDSPMPIYGSFIREYGYRVIGNIHDNPELLNNTK